MREIKFEVWDPNTERMYKNVGIDTIGHYDFQGDAITEQEALVIRQYTGLNDKNGKEIYEGDVLKTRNFEVGNPFTGRVTLRGGRFAVVYPGCYRQDIGESVWDCTVMGTEIIGNIYENADQFPHLLEGRDEAWN